MGEVEGPHPPDVIGGKALDARESRLHVACQFFDDRTTPSFAFLPLHDIPANLPIEQIEFPADGDMGENLSRCDPLLDSRQKLTIATGRGGNLRRASRSFRLHAAADSASSARSSNIFPRSLSGSPMGVSGGSNKATILEAVGEALRTAF